MYIILEIDKKGKEMESTRQRSRVARGGDLNKGIAVLSGGGDSTRIQSLVWPK